MGPEDTYQTINENDENIETESRATEESEREKIAEAENFF